MDGDRTRTDTQDTDGNISPSAWLTVAQASVVLGRTERTMRRYASGEIRTPAGLEIGLQDGHPVFKITDTSVLRTETRKSPRPSVTIKREPLRTELEATRSLLQEKEILIAGLEASVDGKDKLIERLETDLDQSHQSVEHLEILLSQLQKALPAPAEEAVEATVRRPLLWLWILISVVGLVGGLGAVAWWMRWIP